MYVGKDKKKAVLFAFDVHPRYDEALYNVKFDGLDPSLTYNVREINKSDGSQGEEKSYSGSYLMTVGLPLFSTSKLSSRVYEVNSI